MKGRGSVVAFACALALACSGPTPETRAPRLLVLGFDGLDPTLLSRFVADGDLPAFARLAQAGIHRLETSTPPQSPVAWSSFITGLDPGGHGIFDFIHRDVLAEGPGPFLPYLSTSRVEGSPDKTCVGSFAIPRGSSRVELLRRGRAFWNHLADAGVPATVLRIPANFPPEPSEARTLSDMGTPDLRGTYGTFFFYTSVPADAPGGAVSGGQVLPVRVAGGRVRAAIPGPENPFSCEGERTEVPFEAFVDGEGALLEVDGQRLVLQPGEWSEWVRISFPFIRGMASVQGIVRFQLVSTEPRFRLYVSPVNLDPTDPALPISTPPELASELADRVGLYYTQGLPEDTAALNAGRLDRASFLEQAEIIHGERERLLDDALERFDEGLLFVYFGGADQVAHNLWREMESGGEFAEAIRESYRRLDATLARTLEKLRPEDTVIVMSDHGFAPYGRAANLNRWLVDAGYQVLRAGRKEGRELFTDVDWSRTRAYGFGLNGLYLNRAGRERLGTVAAGDQERLLAELASRLLEWRDPETGEAVVARVDRATEVWTDAPELLAPDLVVGYARGYRVSNESALGESPLAPITPNDKAWSGDHCIAPDLVPGVLLANRPIREGTLSLVDLAPTVLGFFGVEPPSTMRGRPVLGVEKET